MVRMLKSINEPTPFNHGYNICWAIHTAVCVRHEDMQTLNTECIMKSE
uniref:Uncharacterized protein n=1 Tax=Arundo donax TaxID=35708 RepID=A0A0A9FK61_ARUDO